MEIKKVCVLGAGNMGSGITQLLAQNGFEVSMRDIEDRFVERGMNTIKGNIQKFFVDKEKMTQAEGDAVIARIKATTDLKEAVSGAQVVIESILEDLQLKLQLFKAFDAKPSPGSKKG